MEFIVKDNKFLFLCDSYYLTFIGIKCHKPLSLSHNSSFDKSLCNAWQSDWFKMVRYIIVSSANSLILLCIFSGMPFIYMRKRHGPSTDLWGTPDRTGQAFDFSPSRTTH